MEFKLKSEVKRKYLRLYHRVKKAQAKGTFATWSHAAVFKLKKRLYRYERRLKRWGIAVASAAALFLSPLTAAGQVTFTERTGGSNPLSSFDVGKESAPTFTDLDGDGDLDLVSGEYYGTFKYYENTGSVTAPVFIERTQSNPLSSFDVGYRSALAFVDLDGDGDLDLVSSEQFGTFKYYENTGSVTAPAFTERTQSNPLSSFDVGLLSAPTFVDLDGDGDMDLVSGEIYGTFKYYENTGSATAPAFIERTQGSNPLSSFNVGTRSAPTFADLDGDGDLDLVSGERFGTFKYYENTGSAIAPAFTERTGMSNPLTNFDVGKDSAPIFADLDGDGDLDLVSGEEFGTFKYYENTTPLPAQATFIERTQGSNPLNSFGVGSISVSAPTFVDLDGDGDLDLVSGELSGAFKYYENTGSAIAPAFTERTQGSNPLSSFDAGIRSSPTFADLDGDGDLDLVSSEYYGIFKYYENTGIATAPAFTERTGGANPLSGFNAGIYGNPAFIDLDGDGDLDLVSGVRDGIFRYYENTGSATAPAFIERTQGSNPLISFNLGFFSFTTPTFVDLDGDGDLDLVSGERYGTFKYYENTGSAIAPAFTERTGGSNPLSPFDVGLASSPTLVDLDGDGDLDLISGERYGTFKYFENTSTALPVDWVTFTGHAEEQGNRLRWTTATEQDNRGFDIERASNGRDFEAIGWVAGAGTTLDAQAYTFMDESPLAEVQYYRLKQEDYDGQTAYSPVITVVRRKAAQVQVFPNPVIDVLTIETATEGVATLYNALGQPVQQQAITGTGQITQIDVSTLPKGHYRLVLTRRDGQVLATHALVKH